MLERTLPCVSDSGNQQVSIYCKLVIASFLCPWLLLHGWFGHSVVFTATWTADKSCIKTFKLLPLVESIEILTTPNANSQTLCKIISLCKVI